MKFRIRHVGTKEQRFWYSKKNQNSIVCLCNGYLLKIPPFNDTFLTQMQYFHFHSPIVGDFANEDG